LFSLPEVPAAAAAAAARQTALFRACGDFFVCESSGYVHCCREGACARGVETRGGITCAVTRRTHAVVSRFTLGAQRASSGESGDEDAHARHAASSARPPLPLAHAHLERAAAASSY